MRLIGEDRGIELVPKIVAVQAGQATLNETTKSLYGILTILDAKATGLLTVNAFFIAALVAFVASYKDVKDRFGFDAPPLVLECQLGLLGASAFLCLLVISVGWRFMGYARTAPAAAADFDDELRRLANVIDDRTLYYWLAWALALAAFVLTLAWWSLLAMLIALVLIAPWVWVRD